jgi:hypothetical protein
MSFTISQIAETDSADAIERLTEDDVVESGLSSGEFRQSMLDRFRQEIKTEDIYFINFSLQPFELEFEEDLVETEEGRQSILTDVENFLYDTEDEDFYKTTWDFHNETIYVEGEND